MREYAITFKNVSVSAVQDLCAAYAGANMAIAVVYLTLGQITNVNVELLQISVKRLPATVTAGAGGGAFTPVPDRKTDAAATFTARINDTTPATTGGTALFPHEDVFNEVNGYQWIFPGGSLEAAPGEALIFSLDSAPSGARTMSGTMKIRELF
jgi:hypothetical protein